MHPVPESETLLDLLLQWEELRQQGKTATPEELCPEDTRLQALLRKRLARRQRLHAALDLPAYTPSEEVARPAPLPVIDGYEIGELLGRGGMGLVFKAVQESLKREVALKIVVSGAHASAAERARFRTEAQAVARLHDPGIVQIYEVGEQAGCPYLALEFVSGGSLAQQLNGTPMPPRRAAQLLLDLAQAVQHAHKQGIVHRDLKPANVLLTTTGAAKITDFGLAKLVDIDQGHTHSGAVLGSPSYMAPEQAAGQRAIGPATDVYALGAILYELLTGRPPFKAETAMETLLQVKLADPVSPSKLQPKLPRDLVTICLRCLEKEPRQRYASALALAEDLRCFLEDRPIRARPVGLLARALKWARRRPAIAAMGAGMCMILALGFAGVTWQWREAEAARTVAEESRTTADEARRTAEDRLYFNRIALAHQAWRGYRVGQADRLLTECLPAAGQDDRRSWEWYYLKRLSSGAQVTLTEHTQGVLGVAYSHDGRLLASCTGQWRNDQPGEVLVWDAPTGKLLHRFHGHERAVYNVAFAPDGRLLASVGFDWTLRLWDLTRPEDEPVVFKSDHVVHNVAFSPDGSILATTCANGTVSIWDVKSRALRGKHVKHASDVFALAFHPTERKIATGSARDNAVQIWDPYTGEHLSSLAWTADVRSVAYSADGKLLAAASYNGAVRVWDLSLPKIEGTTHHLYAGPVLNLAFRPNSHDLAWCTLTGRIQITDAHTGAEVRTFHGHDGAVARLAFSPDGQRLVSAGADRRVRVWPMDAPQEVQTHYRQGGWNYDCAFSLDDKFLALAGGVSQSRPGGHMSVRLWDLEEKRWVKEFKWTDYLTSVAYGRDQLAAGSEDGTAVIWDKATAAIRHKLKAHRGVVTGVAYSPDGGCLVSAGADGTVRWWDTGTGQERFAVTGNGTPLSGVAYSPDGRLVAAAGADPMIRLWDAATGREVHTLPGHVAAITCVVFSPDGKRLASADLDRVVRIWDVGTLKEDMPQKEPIRLDGPDPEKKRKPWDRGRPLIPRIAFSGDGRRLASINAGQPIQLWDVATHLEVFTLPVQQSSLQCVAFSRDSRWLVAGAGVFLHVWDAGEARQSDKVTR